MLQFNCNGLTGKVDEITHFMETNNILLGAIQESKLTKNSSLSSRGNFSIIRKDRPQGKGGGLALIVHNSLIHRSFDLPHPPNNDPHIEQLGISIRSGRSDITIVNIYIPPASSCLPGYKASIAHLLT